MDSQRYSVTLSYEVVTRGEAPSGATRTRTVTLWAPSEEDARTRAEQWARREFGRAGVTVFARADEAVLAQ